MTRLLLNLGSLLIGLVMAAGCREHPGKVVNSLTGEPIAGATIFHNGRITHSDAAGEFSLRWVKWDRPVLLKAVGYRQAKATATPDGTCLVAMEPFDAKGVYLSYYGVRAKAVRERVLQLVESTSVNAVVIDVKPDEGTLSFRWNLPLAEEIGAMSRPTIEDPKALLEQLHSKGIYVIGRISVFKDNFLATKRPEWAIRNVRTGAPYAERDKMAWMDPFRTEVWDYNISVAKAAAEVGFDEIQFDYVRFPVNTGPEVASYRKDWTPANREEAIADFLQRAYRELLPYNVYVAADVFGITCWYDDENGIGQKLRRLAPHTDYLCPMVYPSGFTKGLLGISEPPVAVPRDVIFRSLARALPFAGGNPKKLRPWLQNFKDYAFDKRQFREREIALQVLACEDAKTGGWLLWDSANKYNHTAEALSALEDGNITNLITRANVQ